MPRMLIFTIISALTLSMLSQASSVNPVNWTRIYPVKDCMNFHLVYYKQGDQYFLTYLQGKKYKRPYIHVKSINDLSGIADIIAHEAGKHCAQSIAPPLSEVSCNSLDNLDPEFIKLVQEAANAVGRTGNKCDDLTRYIELYDKISGLDPKNPVQISSASNLGNAVLKLFTNVTDGQLIDHFEQCGGKAQSHKFIENLLLVECHQSCIMPRPPGILSWDEIRAIASRIASKHSNKSILKIRDEKPEIEKDTLLEITRVASLNQIRELMPELDAEKSLQSLDSFTNLQKARNIDNLKDYIKLVYTPDAAIEIAEKSLEGVLYENMRDKLPKEWSAQKKSQYIKSSLMPKALEGFNECMKDPKKRINYGHKASPSINLNFRDWQRKEFCKKNRTICIQAQKPGCPEGKGSINLLSMDPDVTDADTAKSCVMNGLARTVRPILTLTLTNQIDNFNDDVNLPADLAERFSDKAWKQFQGCINSHSIVEKNYHGKRGYRPIFQLDGGTNESAFKTMTPPEFEKLFSDCSEQVELNLTRDFVEVVFISNENVTNNHPHGPTVDFHGTRYPAGAVQYTRLTVKKNLDKCYEKQKSHHQKNPDYKPSPTLCSPLLEIEVARGIIEMKLNKMYKDKKLDKAPEARAVLNDFQTCTNNAYQTTLQDIGNPSSRPALLVSDDIDPYMQENKSFFRCVEAALVDSARIISGHEYKNTINDKKNTLLNLKAILNLEKDVKEVVAGCFQEELKAVGSWPKFKDFNAGEGMTALEQKCGKSANRYALPRIMILETYSQVNGLKKSGFLDTDSEVGKIISLAAGDMKKSLELKTTSSLSQKDYLLEVFGQGLDAYLFQYPTSDQDDYLAYFTQKATLRAVETVRSKLLSKIKERAQKAHNITLTELDGHLTKSCLLDLHKSMSTNKDRPDRKKKNPPFDLNEFIIQIAEGFHYLKKIPPPAFQLQLQKITGFCNGAKVIKNIDDIKETGLLDFIAKAQIQKKALTAFKKMVEENYDSDLKAHEKSESFSKIRPFIEKKRQAMLDLIKNQIEDTVNFDKLLFPQSFSSISSYAIKNSDEASMEGSYVNKELNRMIMTQMFQDKSKDSFSARFSGIQIVNSVGMAGFREAQQGIYSSLKDHPRIPTTVQKYALRALNQTWTVQMIHSRFGWDDLPDFARARLVGAVFDHAILPLVNNENSVRLVQEKLKLNKVVNSHLDNWHKDGKTFKETFTNEIEYKTTEEIKNNKTEALGEALGRWLSW